MLREAKKPPSRMYLSFVLFATLLRTVAPFSSGAPGMACGDMTPQHGFPAQSTNSPYSISVAKTTVTPGEKIAVELVSDQEFKGFFIQAQDASNTAVGEFHSTDLKLTSCGSGTNNAITHASSSAKTKIAFEWSAPSNFVGDVTFKATVVQQFTTFWVGIPSQKVSVAAGSNAAADNAAGSANSAAAASPAAQTNPPAPSTTAAPATTAAPSSTAAPVIPAANPKSKPEARSSPSAEGIQQLVTDAYNDCGTLKSCFGTPAQCVESTSCKVLATFTKAEDKYEFELLGRRSDIGQYIAIGFGHDSTMGDDGVVVCTSENGETDVYNRWNAGKDNIKVSEPYQGLSAVTVGFSDNTMYCRFQKDAKTVINNNEFDFDATTYYILVSAGSFSGGQLRYHGTSRLATDQPVPLGQTSKLSAKDDRQDKLIHGCLMIVAWVCAASTGMLFARYYKKTWVSRKCMSIDIWFHMHRGLMVTTWILTMTAFGIIVYSLKTFRVSNHSMAGIFSVVLCFIQPFMAALRPHPGTPRRPVFNWLHWLVGNSAHICGIAAIFLGIEKLLGIERDWVKEVSWYTLITFIIVHIIVHLMLTISQCATNSKMRKKENEITFPMKNIGDSRMGVQSEENPDAPMSVLRKIILSLYLPLNWVATALLVLLLVAKKEDMEATLTEWGVRNFWADIENA